MQPSEASPDAPGTLARAVAEAVLAVPGVIALDGGRFGQVATYLPGGQIRGIRIDDGRGEVHIVAELGPDLQALAGHVGRVATEITGLPFDVIVEDVRLPDEDDAAAG